MKKSVLFLFLFSLFFVGCNNIGENPNANSPFFVSGTLAIGYESEAYPRSAFPANVVTLTDYTTDFYYYKKGETLVIDEAHKCGTTTTETFTIKIPAFGDYYIYDQSYKTSSLSNPVIEYTTKNDAPLSLTDENPYSASLELVLTPVFIGTGTISLPVKVGTDSVSGDPLVGYLVVSKDGTEIGTYTFTSAAPSATFSQTNYSSGVYEMTFSFYDDSSKTKLLYQCIEKITVLSEKTTDTWVNNGNAEYFKDESGTLTMFISETCIENFALTDFYVGATSLDSMPSDTNSGNYFAPFETLEHAITKINSLSTAKTYTVHISNVIVSAGITISNNVNIVPTGDRATITRKANGNFPVFIINEDTTVKIENIDIDGNKDNCATELGISNLGTLFLVGTKIFNCYNTSSGGGVAVSCGTLTMKGGAISGNTTGGDGGGVFVWDGTFTMEGGTISGNTAEYGGGVHMNGLSTFTMSSGTITGNKSTSGGGVYGLGTFKMTGGEISDNSATENGGGVYVDGTFTMEGGTISGNTAATNGGGIYNNGTFNISGAAQIPAGTDGKNDVYLKSDKYITITGALTGTTPVATITPKEYTVGTQVLAVDGTNVTELTQAICNQFALSDTTQDLIIRPHSTDTTKGILATGIVTSSVELPNEKYTIVPQKSDGSANSTKQPLGANDTVSVGDEITFTVKNSSDTEVTDSVTSYSIVLTHNGNDISSLFPDIITNPSGTSPATKLSAAKIKIPYKLAKMKADIECSVSITINGVRYDSSITIKIADKMTVSSSNFADYIAAVTSAGETNPSIKINVSTSSDLSDIKTAINTLPEGTKIDMEICGAGTSGLAIGESAFKDCNKINSVTFSENVTEIGRMSFFGASLVSVTISASVKVIDFTAFQVCSSFTSITVDESNPNFCSEDGVLFDKTKEKLLCYPAGKTGAMYKIPDTVKTIGQGAFLSNSNITSMEIPVNVTKIEGEAFRLCNNLSELKFADASGWTVDETEVDVTDSAVNASNVIGSWANKTLIKTETP